MAADLTERLDTPLLPQSPGAAIRPEPPRDDAPGTLGSKLLRPHTIISFVLALAIMVFFFRRLDISLADVRADLSRANPVYVAAAFLL